MLCIYSCIISLIFIIAMIYFYNITENNKIIMTYKASLNKKLQKIYYKISKERMNISLQGYILGFFISLAIIIYNLKLKKNKLSNISIICIVISISFIVNYFYYILSPKTDWMLNHIHNSKDIYNWLMMYREMQYHYHIGFILGIIAMGIFAYAFRC